MTKEQAVGLALRVAAIFLVLFVLRDSTAALLWMRSDDTGWLPFLISGAALLLVLGILLWRFPLVVAGSLLPKQKADVKVTKWSLEDIQSVAFTVLGAYVLVRAIPDGFYWLIVMYHADNRQYPGLALTPANYASIVSLAIEVVLGVWLLLGARGLLGALRRLREAGLNKP